MLLKVKYGVLLAHSLCLYRNRIHNLGSDITIVGLSVCHKVKSFYQVKSIQVFQIKEKKKLVLREFYFILDWLILNLIIRDQ